MSVTNVVTGSARQLRAVLRRLVAARPWLYLPLYRVFGTNQHLIIKPETELVIEGFPRSANSFTVVAFEEAQMRPVSIAHHLHAPAQIIAGVRRDLPVCVLIREPEAAIRSLLLREGRAPDWAIAYYLWFYRTLKPYRKKILVADFKQVTTDFGDMVDALNGRFGTAYRRPIDDEAFQTRVRARIQAFNQTHAAGHALAIGLPNPEKQIAAKSIDLTPWRRGLAECQALYQDFTGRADDHHSD